ncbi:MAG: metallophosphoesterase family protein [Desulfobacterales bacterium]
MMMTLSGKIGLLADSHGNLPATIAAIHCLQENGAEQLYHLGDLFDSVRNNEFMSVLNTLCNNCVIGIKGNNDHQVAQSLVKDTSAGLSAEDREFVVQYLQKMPMKQNIGPICLAHSLPYENIRALYEPMDDGTTSRAEQVFQDTDYFLTCCGHSHQPMLFRWRSGEVYREPISQKYLIPFSALERYILIVGSVDNGECGLLDFDRWIYQRFRIDENGNGRAHSAGKSNNEK